MIFNRQSVAGNLSVTLIISGVILVIGSTFLLFVLPNMIKPTTKLWLGDGIFNTDIALTEVERERGLSGRTSLESNQALLMAFPTEDEWEIWMKDMKFPIDIVWLNKEKKVIYIVKNASPTDSTSVTYKSEKLAKYVIELPAGTTSEKRVNINNTAIFQLEGEAK